MVTVPPGLRAQLVQDQALPGPIRRARTESHSSWRPPAATPSPVPSSRANGPAETGAAGAPYARISSRVNDYLYARIFDESTRTLALEGPGVASMTRSSAGPDVWRRLWRKPWLPRIRSGPGVVTRTELLASGDRHGDRRLAVHLRLAVPGHSPRPSLVLPLSQGALRVRNPSTTRNPSARNPRTRLVTDFFTELPNEFWRRAAPPESAEADIAFVERQLGLSPGSRIVDVPCGSGRHSLALAQSHVVTGIDISTEAIAHARRAAADANLDIDLAVADMQDIPRSRMFDAAICTGNNFGYLAIGGVREFLTRVVEAVRPGGGMEIDFNAAAETILPGFRGEPGRSRPGISPCRRPPSTTSQAVD